MYSFITIFLYFFVFFSCSDKETDSKSEVKGILERKVPPKTSVPRGQALYIQNGCVACHGKNGAGNGIKYLGEKPNDLRDITQYKYGTSVKEIAQTIYDGIPGSTMTAFRHIPKQERIAIARYIKKMQRK